jgi:hypothetical protein
MPSSSRFSDMILQHWKQHQVDNLQYQTAWDLAMQECLLPGEATLSSKKNPNELPPATSE